MLKLNHSRPGEPESDGEIEVLLNELANFEAPGKKTAHSGDLAAHFGNDDLAARSNSHVSHPSSSLSEEDYASSPEDDSSNSSEDDFSSPFEDDSSSSSEEDPTSQSVEHSSSSSDEESESEARCVFLHRLNAD
jgi:uncharacterized membrane protein YvbJ